MKSRSIVKLSALLITGLFMFSNAYADNVKVDDAVIVQDIKNKLSNDKLTASSNVTVESKNSTVILKGNTLSDQEASRIIEISESADGVSFVDTTQLTVPKSDKSFYDMIITAKVKGRFAKEKLFGDKPVDVMAVHVETINGVVYLSGYVEDQNLISNATKIARTVKGVKDVNSKLNVGKEKKE